MADRLKQLVSHLTTKDMTAEIWQSVPLAPPDSIFKLTAAYKADTFEKKVNLGVGAYRDDNDKPWILPVVKKATQILLNDETLDHEYLPITGLPEFTSAAARLILGPESPAIKEGRVVSVQTISGTGANHLGALFLSRFYHWNGSPKIYLSNPTWANHHAIFKNVGIEPVDYPYYDPKTIGLDFSGFIEALKNAPDRSVFLLHACAHNPTGVDPTQEQWKAIAEVVKAKGHYAFFDCAYQGFASGDLDRDAWAVRHFVEQGIPLLVCQSFAKNAGLYGERVGALHLVSVDQDTANRVKSQMSVLQRSEISNPPAHGARLVSLILNDPGLFEEWKRDIRTMAERIKAMRRELRRLLAEELQTPGNWEHIVQQIGMFSFTGLDGEQCRELTEKGHIYLTGNGRISMAGLNSSNIRYVAEQIDGVFFQKSCDGPVRPPTVSEMSAPPAHIALPPPPERFYTPPSSPALSPTLYFTPPTSPFTDQPPAPLTDDPFPPPSDHAIDLALEEDGLTTLEKIYLYSRSKAVFHRVFIAHALPDYLLHVTPQEAVEYVLPLLSGLAMDEEETVKEALAAELVHIIWWFFTHCQIIPDDPQHDEAFASSSTTVTISVQAFTPILGNLLLSSNPLVGGAARFAVVDLLSRMKKADDRQLGAPSDRHHRHLPGDIIHPWEIAVTKCNDGDDDEEEQPLDIGLFRGQERHMFTQEILQQVVIGMGRLDVDFSPQPGPEQAAQPQPEAPPPSTAMSENYNPYFPPLPSNLPSQPTSPNTVHHPSPSFHDSQLRPSSSSAPVYSPGTEFPPDVDRPPATSPRIPIAYERSLGPSQSDPNPGRPGSPMSMDVDWQEMNGGDEEQATMGRLSSMSLMAAVTASGNDHPFGSVCGVPYGVSKAGVLDGEMQQAFVKEVERVGRDTVYWVRREASFALGALAKVVPEEVVLSSLLPLFDSLKWDSVWHVRHSALFALPAILARLTPPQRRQVAVETITALSTDQNPTVRSGVLEALGEVIYSFRGDPDGPPQELVHLFLGRKEDRRVRDGQQAAQQDPGSQTPMDSFYADPKRPLICAFNFPAVTLTLGGYRWTELREAYIDIASYSGNEVRRTLAASLGEIAKIIGPEHARKDLVDVWWASIQSDEGDVRMKAIEALHDFAAVVGREVGGSLVQGLLSLWNEGRLRNWRERDLIERSMVTWVAQIGPDSTSLVLALLVRGLEDSVATVRETAISILPDLWNFFAQNGTLEQFHYELRRLATSSNYRRRMTFVACQQTLALRVDKDGQHFVSFDEGSLQSVADLAKDRIEGVRIGVARFAGLVLRTLLRESRPIPMLLRELVRHLSEDPSHEVQAYVAGLSVGEDQVLSLATVQPSRKRLAQTATFSRPPLPLGTGSTDQDESMIDQSAQR